MEISTPIWVFDVRMGRRSSEGNDQWKNEGTRIHLDSRRWVDAPAQPGEGRAFNNNAGGNIYTVSFCFRLNIPSNMILTGEPQWSKEIFIRPAESPPIPGCHLKRTLVFVCDY